MMKTQAIKSHLNRILTGEDWRDRFIKTMETKNDTKPFKIKIDGLVYNCSVDKDGDEIHENQIIATPLSVKLLLHFHISPDPYPGKHPAVVRSEIERFLEWGAIEETGNTFQTTELGKAWVRAICRTKLPQQVYIDQHGEVL